MAPAAVSAMAEALAATIVAGHGREAIASLWAGIRRSAGVAA